MNSHIPTNLLDSSSLTSLIIPSSAQDLLGLPNTLLKCPGTHHLEQSCHTTDSDTVHGLVFGELKDMRELFHKRIGRFDQKAKFEDLRLDGLFLDQRRTKCLTFYGVVKGIFSTNPGQLKGGAGETKTFGVEVWDLVSIEFIFTREI